MKKWIYLICGAMLLLATMTQPACFAAEVPKQELVMGFVPSRDVSQIQLSADRIAHYLSEQTGYRIKAITVQSYAAIVVGMSNKTIDIAFLGPLDYVVGHIKNGAYPITASVRDGKKGYNGIIIVRKDGGITDLKDLKGKTVALGDPLSASSNLYPKSAMIKAGVEDVRAMTLSSASAIVVSVVQGKVDAGAVYQDARKNPEVAARFPNIMNETRVIHMTETIPADPQIVRKDLNPGQVQTLKRALLALSSDGNGKKWLKELFGIDRLAAADDVDYDELRRVIREVNPMLLNP
ncbi:MAG: phosphate/phosphite/phosphonate ABC transporter substrate-binding protein [Sideroxyarcus sp.]|nr:phosphate/phosphite/phosphonate ABC transporter substrate-binding protein [Sideroxyarcus sp.]